MWIQDTEGSSFWLNVLIELQNRGLNDIFIACVDGLTGFPEAIKSAFPNTLVQFCIVHMIRSSLKLVSYRDRKKVAADLKLVYSADTLSMAEMHLERFAANWDDRYSHISLS